MHRTHRSALACLIWVTACDGSSVVEAGAGDAAKPDGSRYDAAIPTDAERPDLRQDLNGADHTSDRASPDIGPADGGADVRRDAGSVDRADAGPPDVAGEELGRGLRWVRDNPMFLSGLTVSMGAPPAAFANDYYDGFHANATHLWMDGLPAEIDGWASVTHPHFRFVAWTQADGSSAANGLVAGGAAANMPGRIGYQISDEPVAWADYVAIGSGAAALRARDPEALLIVNFLVGSDDVQQMLEDFGTTVDADVISYDHYNRGNVQYRNLAKFRAAGLSHGVPYWRYMRSYQELGESGEHTESDLRWDAFAGLTFGYTGHTWFLYQVAPAHNLAPVFFDARGSFDAAKTTQWSTAAQINLEMLNLGRCITQLTSTDVRYVPITALTLPLGLTAWAEGAGEDPFIRAIRRGTADTGLEILVGFFRDRRGSAYTMVQNVRHASGDFPSRSSSPGTVIVEFDFAPAPNGFDRSQVLHLDKGTGEIVAWPLGAGSGSTQTLEVELAAGDPFLFKYDDGTPYALGP